MIYNTVFEVRLKKPLLESIESFFSEQEDEVLRYAIVGMRKGKAVVEATMIKEKG